MPADVSLINHFRRLPRRRIDDRHPSRYLYIYAVSLVRLLPAHSVSRAYTKSGFPRDLVAPVHSTGGLARTLHF